MRTAATKKASQTPISNEINHCGLNGTGPVGGYTKSVRYSSNVWSTKRGIEIKNIRLRLFEIIIYNATRYKKRRDVIASDYSHAVAGQKSKTNHFSLPCILADFYFSVCISTLALVDYVGTFYQNELWGN